MYVSCTACDNKFENETDMKYHLERVHEYGESCHMYPCDKCGFSAGDILSLKKHVDEDHASDGTCSFDDSIGNTHVDEHHASDGTISIDDSTEKTHVDEHYQSDGTSSLDDSIEKLLSENIMVQKRLKQDLADVNFDEDSDEDIEWSPLVEEGHNDDEDVNELEVAPESPKKILHNCDVCSYKSHYPFSMTRHMKVHEGGRKRTLSRDIETDAPPTKKVKKLQMNTVVVFVTSNFPENLICSGIILPSMVYYIACIHI